MHHLRGAIASAGLQLITAPANQARQIIAGTEEAVEPLPITAESSRPRPRHGVVEIEAQKGTPLGIPWQTQLVRTSTIGQKLRSNDGVPGAVQPENGDLPTIVRRAVHKTALAAVQIDDVGVVKTGIAVVQRHEQFVGSVPIRPDPDRLDPLSRREVLRLTGARVDPHQNGVLISISITE